MKRKLFNITAVLCLLLMLATVWLWVDSDSNRISIGYRFRLQKEPSILFQNQSGYIFLGTDDQRFTTYRAPTKGWSFHRSSHGSENGMFSNLSYLYVSRNVSGNIYFTLPHCFLLFFLAILPAFRFISWLERRELLAKVGKCPSCTYDLTGNETGECPECGKSIDTETAQV